MMKLSGFLDASGNQKTLDDNILVVAASLSTPFYWQEFSKEWSAYLIENKYPIEKGKSEPCFHATTFHHGNYPFREEFGWCEDRKKEFYDGLIRLIEKRTLFSIAIGIDLDDYRRFSNHYPGSQSMWASAGAVASAICWQKCSEWAAKSKYDETISYIYDRNDSFAKELRAEYDALCENSEEAKWWRFAPGGLTDGNKEQCIPIQSVDLVAWEVARNYKEMHAAVTEFESRSTVIELSSFSAEYMIFGYEDFVVFWNGYVEFHLEQIKNKLGEDGDVMTEAEVEYARKLIEMSKDEFKKV